MKDCDIYFFAEETRFRLTQVRKTRSAIREILASEGKMDGAINVVFCNDEFLRSCSKQYIGRDYYTDVISFTLSGEENIVSGDVYISIDRVKENARTYQVPVSRELNRVIIHGLLHLCGMSDESEAERLAMREKEDKYLDLLSK